MKKYLYKDLYTLEEKHWWHISKRKTVAEMIKRYNHKENPFILDVGCGTGKNMEELRKIGIVFGLDNSPQALKYCKKRGLRNLSLGKAEKTYLKSHSFDIITLLDILEHTDDNKTLKELSRIIKKDGLIIITVPAFSWLWSKWDEVLHHKRRYTIPNLKKILMANKFQPLKTTYLYSFLVIPALIIRYIKSKITKGNYPSDFKLSNPFINFILKIVSKIELSISNVVTIPFGTSILVVAKKEDE